MSFTIDASDHLILKPREPFRTRLANFIVAYAASLAINVALLLLMFVEITVWVEIPVVEETPIDIVVEPPAPLDPPISCPKTRRRRPPNSRQARRLRRRLSPTRSAN